MRFVTIFKRFTKVTKTFLILFGINICLKTIISNVIISCKSRVWLVLVGLGQVQVIDLPGEGGHRVEVRPLQAVDLLLRGGRHRPAAFQHHTHAKVPLLHLPVKVKVQNTMKLIRHPPRWVYTRCCGQSAKILKEHLQSVKVWKL